MGFMRHVAGAVTLATLAFGAPAGATPITYIGTDTATGSLNGVAYTSALLTITAQADTADVSCGPAAGGTVCTVTPTSMAVAIAGLTSGVSVTSSGNYVFSVTAPTAVGAGFGSGGFDILNTASAALASYSLATAIGPVTGTASGDRNRSFATSGGPLIIQSFDSASTFQSILGATPVPEPASMALLGAGLLGLGALRRRG